MVDVIDPGGHSDTVKRAGITALPFHVTMLSMETLFNLFQRVTGYFEGGHENSLQVTVQGKDFSPGEYIHH